MQRLSKRVGLLALPVCRAKVESDASSSSAVKHLVGLGLIAIEQVAELALLGLDVRERVLDSLVRLLSRDDLRIQSRDLEAE